MSKGGGGSSNQTTTSSPWEGITPYLTGGNQPGQRGIYPQAGHLYNRSGDPGDIFAGFDPLQTTGQNQQINYANQMRLGGLQPYQDALNFGLGGAQGGGALGQSMDFALGGAQGPGALGQAMGYQLGGGFDPSSALGRANQFGLGGGVDPTTALGRATQAGLSGGTTGGGALSDAMNFSLSGALDPNANPYLEDYMQAATRPLQQQLDLQTMPNIGRSFTGAGQYGSSRQGVAEGVAQGLTNQAIGDVRAQIGSAAYGQGLDQQARAMGMGMGQQSQTLGMGLGQQAQAANRGTGLLSQSMGQGLNQQMQALGLGANLQQGALGMGLGQQGQARGQGLDQQARMAGMFPQSMQAGLMPSQLIQDVGAQRQNMAQRRLDEPYEQYGRYASAIQPGTGIGGSVTTPVYRGGGGLMGALGGGMMGMGMGNMIGGSSGAPGGNWPWALGGGLLGGLG